MGLLTAGTPMEWSEALQHISHVKKHGIEQFINLWRLYEQDKGAPLLWGDEVEYFVAELDGSTARLAVRAPEILAALKEKRDAGKDINDEFGSTWYA